MPGPGCILTVEHTGFASGLDERCERKRGIKEDSKVLA